MDGGHILRDFLFRKINRSNANYLSSGISFIFSIIILSYSLYNDYIFISLLSLFFIYQSIKGLINE